MGYASIRFPPRKLLNLRTLTLTEAPMTYDDYDTVKHAEP